jgi:hypothetical protein
MKYYEGSDYWVRYVEFPNMASPSLASSNGDGTFTILINTLFSEERQQEGLEHELRHLEAEHFYRDDRSIASVEQEAAGHPPLPDVFTEREPGKIANFHSLDSIKHYINEMLKQKRAAADL